jgi:hypothetical protein
MFGEAKKGTRKFFSGLSRSTHFSLALASRLPPWPSGLLSPSSRPPIPLALPFSPSSCPHQPLVPFFSLSCPSCPFPSSPFPLTSHLSSLYPHSLFLKASGISEIVFHHSKTERYSLKIKNSALGNRNIPKNWTEKAKLKVNSTSQKFIYTHDKKIFRGDF